MIKIKFTYGGKIIAQPSDKDVDLVGSLSDYLSKSYLGKYEDGPSLNERAAVPTIKDVCLEGGEMIVKVHLQDPGNSWERR